MLAPIRPRPMNPMRMAVSASCGRVGAACAERPLERGQAGVGVGSEVDAQDRQVVRLERLEVAARPGRR